MRQMEQHDLRRTKCQCHFAFCGIPGWRRQSFICLITSIALYRDTQLDQAGHEHHAGNTSNVSTKNLGR